MYVSINGDQKIKSNVAIKFLRFVLAVYSKLRLLQNFNLTENRQNITKYSTTTEKYFADSDLKNTKCRSRYFQILFEWWFRIWEFPGVKNHWNLIVATFSKVCTVYPLTQVTRFRSPHAAILLCYIGLFPFSIFIWMRTTLRPT